MIRPTVRIDGAVQGGGGVVTAQAPNWLEDGATAFWDLQDTGATFEDDGDNLWDVPAPSNNNRVHELFAGKISRQINNAYGSAAHADARITGAMSLALVFRSQVLFAESGIFCYSTGLTDCLWGLGLNASFLPQVRDKRHASGAALVPSPTVFLNQYGDPLILFGTRSSAGVWKLFVDGAKRYTSGSAAAPAVVGDEVVVIGGRNELSFIGLWESELSESEVARLTKKCKPWLDL